MPSIKVSQDEHKNFSLELDLELINISAGELISKISQLDEFCVLEWSQYTEYAIGKILYLGEIISVVWEDFPNEIDFYSTSEKKIKVLEYELKNLVN